MSPSKMPRRRLEWGIEFWVHFENGGILNVLCGFYASARKFRAKNVSGCLFGFFAARSLPLCRHHRRRSIFHLLRQVFAGARVGKAQAVFVDEHGLVARPCVPCFLRDVFKDAFAQGIGQRREFHAFGFLPELWRSVP